MLEKLAQIRIRLRNLHKLELAQEICMAYGEAVVGICLLFQEGVNFLSWLVGTLFSFSNSSLGGWGVQHVGMFCLWPLTPFSHPAFDIPPQCTVTQLFCIEIEAKLELVDQQQFPPPIPLSGIFSFPRIKPLAKMGRPMWKTRNPPCVLTSSPCVKKTRSETGWKGSIAGQDAAITSFCLPTD